MDDNGLIDSEYPKSVSAGPSPLPRFHHPDQGDAEIVTSAIGTSNQEIAEKLPEMVTDVLSALPDGPTRTRIARDIWAAADAFLRT